MLNLMKNNILYELKRDNLIKLPLSTVFNHELTSIIRSVKT